MRITDIYLEDFGIFNKEKLRDISPGLVVIGGSNRSGKTTLLQVLRYLGYGFPRSDSLPPAAEQYHVEADLAYETGAEESSRYHLKITGHSRPILNPAALSGSQNQEDKEEITLREIYNNLDSFTYHQLFTISLDELQKIPAGLSRQEEQRLQSVLLGAGLNRIVKIPEIAEDYRKQARQLGGKLGNPGVASFGTYQERIAAAEKKKNEALQQVEDYQQHKSDISQLEENIQETRAELDRLEQEQIRLDILKNNYHNYQKLLELKEKLSKHAGRKMIQEKYSEKLLSRAEDFQSRIQEVSANYQKRSTQLQKLLTGKDLEQLDDFNRALLEKENQLDNFSRQLSGLKERIRRLEEDSEQLKSNREELRIKAGRIRPELAENLEMVESLSTDLIERQKLVENVEKYKELNYRRENLQQELVELEEEISQSNKRLKDLKSDEPGEPKRVKQQAYLSAALSLLLGGLAGWYNLLAGSLLGVGGLIFTLIYFFSRYQLARDSYRKIREQQEDLEVKETRLAAKKKQLAGIDRSLQEPEKKLQEYQRLLGLEADTGPELVREYFSALKDLKESYHREKLAEERLAEQRKKLKEKLSEIRELLVDLNQEISSEVFLLPEEDSLPEESSKLFASLENALEYLSAALQLQQVKELQTELIRQITAEFQKLDLQYFDPESGISGLEDFLEEYRSKGQLALEFNELQQQSRQLERQIQETLNSADRIREAFLALEEETAKTGEGLLSESRKAGNNQKAAPAPGPAGSKILESFARLYRYFTSREEVESALSNVQDKLESLEEKHEQQKEELQRLKNKKEELASPQKIEEAHAELDQARSSLRQLAEDYARNRTAAFILEKVRERVIGRAREELLQPAAQILARFTGGEYQEIAPPADLSQPDFTTVLEDGRQQEEVSILSRGTAEQLFLAVRLSRIREIKPPLPVILDDSLVNFDRQHLHRAARILAELGSSHQIFILTCHPHLVDYLSRNSEAAESIQYWRLERGRFARIPPEGLIDYLAEID